MTDKGPWKLIINQKPYEWPNPQITGRDIKKLAGSPTDWIVNQIIAGPGEDPEIGDDTPVDLTVRGHDRFVTRKPTTSPGV
jgi:hypothetical protein